MERHFSSSRTKSSRHYQWKCVHAQHPEICQSVARARRVSTIICLFIWRAEISPVAHIKPSAVRPKLNGRNVRMLEWLKRLHSSYANQCAVFSPLESLHKGTIRPNPNKHSCLRASRFPVTVHARLRFLRSYFFIHFSPPQNSLTSQHNRHHTCDY